MFKMKLIAIALSVLLPVPALAQSNNLMMGGEHNPWGDNIPEAGVSYTVETPTMVCPKHNSKTDLCEVMDAGFPIKVINVFKDYTEIVFIDAVDQIRSGWVQGPTNKR